MTGPRILVTGRTGQVARALDHVAGRTGERLVCIGRPALDLAQPGSIRSALAEHTPDVVINTAAFTSVDGAEENQAEAFKLNRDGVSDLWEACQARGAALVHLSTDCVFDGELDRPYRPGDATGPLGVYGRSKLAGEDVLKDQPALVVRVSWIFSRFGSNFLKTMLQLAIGRDEVTVVEDQLGCPTHAEDLAWGLIAIARRVVSPGFMEWGTYHLAGTGATDRASQARAIFMASREIGGPLANVRGVATSEYATPARRPLNARLDCSRTLEVFDVRLPRWESRLKDAVYECLEQGSRP